ncbi:MAG: DNA-directed RNA polymerase subunit alpha [Armatimonadota bacterium]
MITDIGRPNITSKVEENYGKFVIEPLPKGYGTTIGNSLRRVLLSSLEGAAITHIKIEGILHEFSTIPGVYEDTTEIILNLKKVRLKLHTEFPKTLRLEAKGKKEVKVSDIAPDADVEILNPDLVIATLTGKDSKLVMELRVSHGRGYVPAEKQEGEEKVIGLIPVDSIFSPITKVNYVVEDARVGHLTNFDRLILELWSDGSVTPQEALNKAGEIVEHYFGLIKDFRIVSEEDKETEESQLMGKPVESLNLSIRSYNCLKRSGIKTVGELFQLKEEDFMKMKNFGLKSLEEIREKYKEHGLMLRSAEIEEDEEEI